jgi:hypothetical protein
MMAFTRGSTAVASRIRPSAVAVAQRVSDVRIGIVQCADERLDDSEAAPGGQSRDRGEPNARVIVLEEPHQRLDGLRILHGRERLGRSYADCGVLERKRLDKALGVSLGLQLANVGGTEERHLGSLFR